VTPGPEERSRFDLVIFDSDGVLVDSELLANRALAQTLTAYGLATTPEQAVAEYRGRILADVVARVDARAGRSLDEQWITDFEQLRALLFKEHLTAMPGVRELIEAVVAGGVDRAVATQGKPEKTELTLGLTGLRELFDVDAVFTSYEVARGKPAPDLYLHVAERRGADPARCAVIEDTLIGMTAGLAAGMCVFGLASVASEREIAELGATPFREFAAIVPQLNG
jgi:HAD superfamily hydrolase (TIGR01509 family)